MHSTLFTVFSTLIVEKLFLTIIKILPCPIGILQMYQIVYEIISKMQNFLIIEEPDRITTRAREIE